MAETGHKVLSLDKLVRNQLEYNVYYSIASSNLLFFFKQCLMQATPLDFNLVVDKRSEQELVLPIQAQVCHYEARDKLLR